MIRRVAPSLLSGLRAPLAAALCWLIVARAWRAAVLVLLAAGITDVADGWLARRTDARTTTGAYIDVCADLLVVLAGFGGLALIGAIPRWLPAVLVAVFAQFLLTSGRRQPIYDPVGKYFGGFLYGALGVALALPDLAMAHAVTVTVAGMTAATLGSRTLHLARGRTAAPISAP